MKTRFDHVLAALFIVASGSAAAQTPQAWPTRPVKLIVGYPPGSSPDMHARLIAEPLALALGQPIVVENRPGAGGNLGAEALARADDGHTIAVIGNGPLTSSALLYTKLAYHPTRDLAPLALIASAPLVWVAAKTSDASSAARFIVYARQQGDKLYYGSVGAGSGTHLGMELIKQALNIAPMHVPFNGSPAIVNAIAGGHVQTALLATSSVMPLVQSGKLEALAVSSAQRSPLAPTLPSMEEIGVKGVNIEVWNAVMAPASMPAAHRARLSDAIQRIVASREVRQQLLLQGWKAEDAGAATLAQRIARDTEAYRQVIARTQTKLD